MATGRKTVVVGQVIDPDTWGNPLWDQSVQTFASAADRTAQFPAPKAGALTWLDDVKRLDVFDGAAWRTVDADVRDWSVLGTVDVPFAASTYVTYLTLNLPATAPPGRYLITWTTLASVSAGTVAVAGTLRLQAGGTGLVEPRNDIDNIGRPYTHTHILGHPGGAVTLTVQVNVGAAGSVRAQGTNLRAVLL